LPLMKCSRRIRAIVSTTSIPDHLLQSKAGSAAVQPIGGGQFWTPIPRLGGQYCKPNDNIMGRLGPSSRDLSCARVSGKRNFAARDKCPETAPKVLGHPLQRIDMGKESRQLGAGLQGPGNLCECRNAWWAREDSNLQPSGYEHPNFTRKFNQIRYFRSYSPSRVLVRLLRSIGYSLVGPRGVSNTWIALGRASHSV
jgi:hypothetical protein